MIIVKDKVFFNAREQDWYEERAGILEYEAGMEREQAEEEAYRLMKETRKQNDQRT